MIYTKGLLLKGLLGFGATSSAVYVGLSQQERIAEFFSGGKETEKPAAITDDLLGNVGLNCPPATAEGVICSKKTGDQIKIKVKQESTEFEVSDLPSGNSGKIKLYKLTGDSQSAYNQGLKFVIEEGNITEGDKKLEEFETYEIEEVKGENGSKKYYLSRKTKASDKIKVLLGLDSCPFPEGAANASQSCTITNENIDKIKFEGKDGKATGTGTLKIDIVSSTETIDFPFGFKFTLTPASGNISIPKGSSAALTLTGTKPTVFKIKKKEDKTLTLEEALTQETLTEKVGLSCTGTPTGTEGAQCSKRAEASNIKVKQGDSTSFNLTSLDTGGGKIKLYKDEGSDYNKGFKFVIEDNDITDTGNSNKLEQFETYEIKQEDNGGEWKLTRKKKSWEEKRRILGLPDDCVFPEGSTTSKECTIKASDVSSIAFDGKTSAATLDGGTATLKVEVTPTTEATDFPLGYKFTLTPTGGTLTINRSADAGNITLNSGTPKEFKIKQDTENKKQLTLEEAWTLTTLAGKVGLSCNATSGAPTATAGVDCSKTGTSEIKVKKDTADLKVSNITQGKIKVYKTSSGETHNEGFKFVIEENDITATNGGGSGNKLEQFETYEIKKDSSEWKLVRKEDAKNGIKKALGLDQIEGCDLPNPTGCDVSGDKFKKIKFSAGDTNRKDGPTNAKLKITTESGQTEYPFGYKFVLDSTSESKISDSLTIAGNTNTEFKIKRESGTNNISLEKALDVVALGKKVNLTCTTGNGNKDCSLDSGKKINVKDGDSSRKGVSFQNGDSEKKLTYADNTDGYNQGIKFTAAQEICLGNGEQSSGGTPNKIENGGTGYEIKKEGSEWFLVKKNSGA